MTIEFNGPRPRVGFPRRYSATEDEIAELRELLAGHDNPYEMLDRFLKGSSLTHWIFCAARGTWLAFISRDNWLPVYQALLSASTSNSSVCGPLNVLLRIRKLLMAPAPILIPRP